MITTFTASLTTSGSLVELLHSKVEINHPEISDNSINLDHLGLRSHGSTVYGTMKTQDPVPICFFPTASQGWISTNSWRVHGTKTGGFSICTWAKVRSQKQKKHQEVAKYQKCVEESIPAPFKGWKIVKPEKMVHPVTEPNKLAPFRLGPGRVDFLATGLL